MAMVCNNIVGRYIGDLARLSNTALELRKVLSISAECMLGKLSFLKAVSKKRRDGTSDGHDESASLVW
jgi:hypothetical protein